MIIVDTCMQNLKTEKLSGIQQILAKYDVFFYRFMGGHAQWSRVL